MRTILKQGKIYDGNSAEAFIGDILIDDDRILQVAQHPNDATADEDYSE